MRSLVTVALACALTAPAAAHIGGEIVRPVFFTPAPGIVIVDGPLTVSWNDPDEDPTGVLHFYYTDHHVPPTAALAAAHLAGAAKIGEAPVSDPLDAIDWDPAPVAPGVYTLHAISVDPPLCDTTTPAATTLVVRDPGGAPLPLAGAWTNPPVTFNGVVSGLVNLRLEALSESPPTVTLVVGRIEPIIEGPVGEECSSVGEFHEKLTLASDVAGEVDAASGMDRWTFRYLWDSDALLPGPYVLRADFGNADGQTHSLYSPVEVPVTGTIPGVPDDAPDVSGPEAGPESAPDANAPEASAEEGVTYYSEPPKEDPGCSGGPPGSLPAVMLLLLAFVFRARGRAFRP